MFTVNRLGLPRPLRRCLTTTNIIDSSHAGGSSAHAAGPVATDLLYRRGHPPGPPMHRTPALVHGIGLEAAERYDRWGVDPPGACRSRRAGPARWADRGCPSTGRGQGGQGPAAVVRDDRVDEDDAQQARRILREWNG